MPLPLQIALQRRDESLRQWITPGITPGITLALISLLAAAACQPLPRPFQPDGKRVFISGQLEAGPRAGLIVAAPDGLSEEPSQRLAALVAANLRDRGIAATTGSTKQQRFHLHATAEREKDPFAAPEDAVTVTIRWVLKDSIGDVAGTTTQTEEVSPLAWARKNEPMMIAIAARAAPQIERMLNGYGDTPIPAQPLDTVVVYRVDGAPGDGSEALLKGMIRALRIRRVPIVTDISDDTYVVLGAVYTEEGSTEGQEIVHIEWTVLRPDGQRVGSIKQQNAVESGRLDGAWGNVALAAAGGAAGGIVSLLEAIGVRWESLPAGK